MKLSEIYPEMSNAHRKFVINSLLASFEYILEVGEDGVCQALVDDGIDASMFGNVARRVEEYRRSCKDAKLRAALEARPAQST